MKLERLKLRNFRNVVECEFQAGARLNFLVGKNGQGKTSIIEAIGYLSTLRSFRGAKTEEVIRNGEAFSEISCSIVPGASGDLTADDNDAWRSELKVVFSRGGDKTSKTAFINGKAFRSSAQYVSQRYGSVELGFHSIVFNPADHQLVQGDPAERRSYLNRVIAAEDIEYLKTLQGYQRLIEQRNALLKQQPGPRRELLRGFSEPLAERAALLTLMRLQWLEKAQNPVNAALQKIAPGQPPVEVAYVSSWVSKIPVFSTTSTEFGHIHFAGLPQLPSLELLRQSFLEKLSALEEVELRSGVTLVGPHRDDWMLFLGDQPLKGRGSQGEIRSTLLALKLSEIQLFRERTGHVPLLLLDDFSSELDQERREFLLDYLIHTDLQVFVTTTAEVECEGRHFRVVEGTLR